MLASATTTLNDELQTIASRITKVFDVSIESQMALISKAVEELPEKTKRALRTLALHGWFIDMDMSPCASLEFEQALNTGDPKNAEQALMDYFELNLDRIEESLKHLYPKRSNVIKRAFAAHRRGEYELSVPVLLTQVDGICVEVTQGHFFIGKKKPMSAKFVEEIASESFRSALLSPLAEKSTIHAYSDPISPKENVLNRHAILHGHVSDYGTKLNSLKAVSLLNYVGGVLKI